MDKAAPQAVTWLMGFHCLILVPWMAFILVGLSFPRELLGENSILVGGDQLDQLGGTKVTSVGEHSISEGEHSILVSEK